MNPGIMARLLAGGFSPVAGDQKAELFGRAGDALRGLNAQAEENRIHCFVPGRVELLGKHTDYAGGRSLLCAVERGICAVAVPRDDAVVRMADAGRNQQCEFLLSPELDPLADRWPIYPRTVARRLARNFSGPLRGMDAAFASDLPRASGMSSSSALLTCTYLLLEECNDLSRRPEFEASIRTPEEKAAYLACIENGQTFGILAGDAGVGTFGGSEDHTAILCSRPGVLRQYAFCPTRLEAEAPLRSEYAILIAVSGVAADKTGAAREQYNRASRAAGEILEIWREATGRADASLFAAAGSAEDAPARIRELLNSRPSASYSARALRDRFDQFFEESMCIVPDATRALQANHLEAFGRCVDRSRALAEEKLGNQIPQTTELAHSARELGAFAASAFGAGFGGSVWAMTRAHNAKELLNRWQESYRRKFPVEAQASSFFLSGAGPAAFVF